MLRNSCAAAALCAGLIVYSATPALAAGEILLTHAGALAGNVTPGDAPGYPITLSLSRTYQFAGVIHPSAGSIGIQVIVNDVTIDLNGFRMHGSGVAFHGIAGGVDSVTIKNGTITHFLFDAIHGTGSYWTVENMRVVENGRDGIFADGNHTAIRSSTSAVNGDDGIHCGNACRVENSNVSNNGNRGVFLDSGIVIGNSIQGNADTGLLTGGTAGYSQNVLFGNNGAGDEVGNALEMNPNLCVGCP